MPSMITQFIPSSLPSSAETRVACRKTFLLCCDTHKKEITEGNASSIFCYVSCLFLKMGTKRLTEVEESSWDIKDCGDREKVRLRWFLQLLGNLH